MTDQKKREFPLCMKILANVNGWVEAYATKKGYTDLRSLQAVIITNDKLGNMAWYKQERIDGRWHESIGDTASPFVPEKQFDDKLLTSDGCRVCVQYLRGNDVWYVVFDKDGKVLMPP